MCGINYGPAECRVIVNSLLHTYRHFRIQGMLHVLQMRARVFTKNLRPWCASLRP
jgi:hypothetical protein